MISGKREFLGWSGLRALPGLGKGCLLALAALCFALGVTAQASAEEGLDSIVASKVERVATGFQFTEGPIWHPKGFLIFSDIPADRIVKCTEAGEIQTFRQPSGNSNGLTFDQQGRLIACEHGNRRVSRTEADEKVVSLADKYQGKRLNSPNDVVVRSDGSVYFTDPPYGIVPPLKKELDFNGVFRISPKGNLTLLVKDFDRPNGLGFSPDEKTLYIADTARSHIRAFRVQPDGSLKGGKEFVKAPGPDGMKVDAKGNLYVTSRGGVMVFDPHGKTIGTIPIPEVPANCCFGDPDNKTLYITARTSLYKVRLKVPGLKVGPAAVKK